MPWLVRVEFPRYIASLLLAATVLLGIAHIAFLPPWEGLDETAHWSYIQTLSDTGQPPRYGVDGIAADLSTYRGPMPYGDVPPFEHTGRPTFRSYRQAGAPAIAAGPTRYTSTTDSNWEAQHPPLYYALMVPIYRTVHGMGWVDHLLVLRLASFALAFLGLWIGVAATARSGALGPWGGPIMAAWPFLFPQFFPEFGRLGNDGLCLLLTAVSWGLLLRLLTGKGRWISALGLGAALGLGLLSKAFFLPIGAGVGAMLLARWWVQGRRLDLLAQAALAGVVALAIGGWWYLAKRLETGSFTGADEFIHLNQLGGLARIVQGYSFGGLLKGLAVICASFAWGGTWSLTRLPEILLLPPLALLGLTVGAYAGGLKRWTLVDWAPIAMTLPVLAGLIYHVFVWMAGVSAETPGWYLHILAAPLGYAVARGWTRPRALAALAALTTIYTAAAWAFQLSMFSGCAAKLGADKHFSLQGGGCLIDLHTLGAIAHPGLGFASLAMGLMLAGVAATLAWRSMGQAQTVASRTLHSPK